MQWEANSDGTPFDHCDGLRVYDYTVVRTSDTIRYGRNNRRIPRKSVHAIVGKMQVDMAHRYRRRNFTDLVERCVILLAGDLHHMVLTPDQMDKHIEACIKVRDEIRAKAGFPFSLVVKESA